MNLRLLKRRKVAIDAPIRAGVALRFDLSIEGNPLVFALFPAFEDIGRKGIKGARFFSSFSGFRERFSSKPSLDGTGAQTQPTSNIFGRHPLLPQFHHLLVASISARTSRQSGFLNIARFRRDRKSTRLNSSHV